MDFILALITAVGGGAIVSLVQFFVTRHDNKNSETIGLKKSIDEVNKKLDKVKKDSERTQLLLLMTNLPDRKQEIMQVAHQYFICDNGNWFMTDLFMDWCNAHDVDYEPLFKEKETH